MVTSSVVGRHPNGCRTGRLVRRSADTTGALLDDPAGQPRPGGSRRWLVTASPRSSRRQQVVTSAQAKPATPVASCTSRSSSWAASELPSSEDLDPYPGSDAPTTPTPPSVKSREILRVGGAGIQWHLYSLDNF